MQRDHQRERELLERVQGPAEFTALVLSRLAAYEAEHGNTGWDRPVDQLLGEIEEEAADIAGWGVGAAHQLDDTQLHRLVVAMSLGAAAWREIRELRNQLTRPSP